MRRGPLGPDQGLAERDGHTGLAGARRLDDQGLAVPVGEPLDHPLDGLDLVEPVDDLGVGPNSLTLSRFFAWKIRYSRLSLE